MQMECTDFRFRCPLSGSLGDTGSKWFPRASHWRRIVEFCRPAPRSGGRYRKIARCEVSRVFAIPSAQCLRLNHRSDGDFRRWPGSMSMIVTGLVTVLQPERACGSSRAQGRSAGHRRAIPSIA